MLLKSSNNRFFSIKIYLQHLTIDPPFSFSTFRNLTKLIFLLANTKENKLIFDQEDIELIKEVIFFKKNEKINSFIYKKGLCFFH